MDSTGKRTVRMLMQPSIHMYLLLNELDLHTRDSIVNAIVEDDIQGILKQLELLIASNEGYSDDSSRLTIYLQARLFVTELRQSYFDMMDLYKHKHEQLDTAIMIERILSQYSISQSGTIAQEIYNELFVKNNKKTTIKSKKSEDDVKRDLDLLKKYTK